MTRVRTITRYLLLLTLVTGIVGCDHITKHVATETLSGKPAQSYFFDVVRLGYTENTGSFLSFGADLPGSTRYALFILASGLLLVFLVVYAMRARRSGMELFGLALFIAGGSSNWVDRFMHGRVVDFLNVGIGSLRTGIFNVADMAILTGFVILMFSEYLRARMMGRGPS